MILLNKTLRFSTLVVQRGGGFLIDDDFRLMFDESRLFDDICYFSENFIQFFKDQSQGALNSFRINQLIFQ